MRETTDVEKFAKGSELIVESTGHDKCVGPGESKENPILILPEDVPYGAWFKCDRCGVVARSTFSFDCYGDAGTAPICEYCMQKELRKQP